ncbi:hypothetical protein P4S64_13115 [Vibrio sp. M60_M31a]
MQLFMAFFGLSLLGIEVSAWSAAALALTPYSSAYFHDIWRGCIEALPKGQVGSVSYSGSQLHADYAQCHYSCQAYRIAIAPTIGFSVQIVKRHRACFDHRFCRVSSKPEPC